MIEFQYDHEQMTALLELMAATNESSDPQTIAAQALDQLLAREVITAGGIWLEYEGDLECLIYRNLDPDLALPEIRRVLAEPAPTERHHASHLTILPLRSAGNAIGALAVGIPTRLDPGELLLRAVAAHLGGALASARQSRSDQEWQAFLNHAAHEIKNPLASIKGYADLLIRRAAKDPADPYRKGLSTISTQVGRTTALLEQISDIARISTGSLAIDRRVGDFAALVEHVVQEYPAGDYQATLAFDSDNAVLPSRFDHMRLHQVVGAIIGNAIKFSPDGGTIKVLLRRSQMDDGAPVALLAVSDTGVGVPAGERERVFERFFRGSNIHGTYAGLGLGLYIARHILDLHGGRIWLESARGQGTTCYMTLPLSS